MPEQNGLDDLRKQIDELDKKLVELLSMRAKVVVEVGKFKRDTDTRISHRHKHG